MISQKSNLPRPNVIGLGLQQVDFPHLLCIPVQGDLQPGKLDSIIWEPWRRAVRMLAVLIGLALVSCSTIVRAYDYKDPADAAYCVGSLRKQNEITKMLVTTATDYEVAVHREAERKLSERKTFVEGSIEQGTLFAAIASRMIDDGYADADLCTQINSKCTAEHISRLKNNFNKASSEAEFDDCTRPIVASCNRIHKCDG
jgi:hypothetical protein